MANREGHYKTSKPLSSGTVILATLVSVALLSSVLIANIGLQEAYAAKGGNGGGKGGGNSSDSGDKGKSHDKGQSDKETSSNANKEEDQSNEGQSNKDNSNGKKTSQSSEGKKQNNTNLVKAQKYKPHKLNETMAWSYYANITSYSLEASGIAKAIGKSNNTANATADAELSAKMSVWKARQGLVSMDIMDGSIMVGGNAMEFYSGQAHYMPDKNKMLLVGFIIESQDNGSATDNGGTGDNQTTTDTGATNQTSTTTNQTSTEVANTNQTSVETSTNQTSTVIPDDGEQGAEADEEPVLRHVKLWIRVTEQDGSLPSDSVAVEVLSPQSKISSEWFLQMVGELSSSP
jgi:hypothetical protein